MKSIPITALLSLLLTMQGCGGSGSNSQDGNESPTDAGTQAPVIIAGDIEISDNSVPPPPETTDSTDIGELNDSNNPNDLNTPNEPTEPNQPGAAGSEQPAAGGSAGQAPLVPTPLEPAPAEPAPVVIELNDIEKAILNPPNTQIEFPDRIDHFNFGDDSPGAPVPNPDTPIDNAPFQNELQRISSASKFSVGDTVPTHQYSKRQAWNSNETLIAIGEKILRTSDYKILVESVPMSSARTWSHLEPEIIYGFRFNQQTLNEFGRYNVAKDQFTLLKRFDEFQHCTIGRGEGSISNDDRYVVFACVSLDQRTSLVSFDIANRSIIRSIVPENAIDWAGFSQSGRYIVVANEGNDDATRRLTRYNNDFSEPYLITTKTHHGDLGIDQYGDDVIVMIGPSRFSYIRLKDKQKVTFPVTDTANPTGFGHVSCRNIKRPGWCYVSTYNQTRLAALMLDFDGNSTPTADEDGELSYKGVRVVEAWGVHRSTSANYDKTPRASASPSGTSLVFSSDWYGSTGANAYVLSLSKTAR